MPSEPRNPRFSLQKHRFPAPPVVRISTSKPLEIPPFLSCRLVILAALPGNARLCASMRAARKKSPRQELDGFISGYTPEIAARARKILQKMRARLPGAVELVYDNFNALAIGFGPTERASDAIFSIALFPRWVSLFFLQGAKLEDPEKILKGAGNKVRHVVLEDARSLDRPALKALMKQALERTPKGLDPKARNRVVIKSISARKRPRRPA